MLLIQSDDGDLRLKRNMDVKFKKMQNEYYLQDIILGKETFLQSTEVALYLVLEGFINRGEIEINFT